MKDYLNDANDDLIIENGDFLIGKSLDQEVGIIARLNQGDLKSDPVLGAGLFRMINSNATDAEIKSKMKLHLERDGKNYEDFKNAIRVNK